MAGRRRTIAVTRFPVMGSKFSTFCLGTRVTATGKVHSVGMVRCPASDRPKVGGGRAVPYTAMNPRGAA